MAPRLGDSAAPAQCFSPRTVKAPSTAGNATGVDGLRLGERAWRATSPRARSPILTFRVLKPRVTAVESLRAQQSRCGDGRETLFLADAPSLTRKRTQVQVLLRPPI